MMKYSDINILIKDKSWHKILTLWAAACAEHVLPWVEEKVPNDMRPRKAIEAAKEWVNDELKMLDARKAAFAAHAAARETENKSAIAAARSAGHAAATAHVAIQYMLLTMHAKLSNF